MAAFEELFGLELQNKGGPVATAKVLAGKTAVGIYFSAQWCQPCREFTPVLSKMYTGALQSKGMEIVFVSSDRKQKDFNAYYRGQPWLALPFGDKETNDKLSAMFEVVELPCFIILDSTGKTITTQGRAAVSGDPIGENYPWIPTASMKVTVLSGFLGAGKTTLLKRILRENNKRSDGDRMKIAVIVNDMGEINLDADEIKHSKLIQEEAEMVELHNGCICCTLRGDLLKTVKSLSQEKTFDYLVIESTGISEPLPVAQTFVMDANDLESGQDPEHDPSGDDGKNQKLTVATAQLNSLSQYATLDTMVTVVDALNIFDVLSSIEKLSEENSVGMVGNSGQTAKVEKGITEEEQDAEGGEEEEVDDRSLAQLMLDQLEFANVIVLSKAQLLVGKDSEEKLEGIQALLKKLNPKARIIIPRQDKYEDMDVAELLNTGLFDMEEASESAGWQLELEKEEHAPETEEYGISSTVFRANKMPFHPERLNKMLNGFGNYRTAMDASTSSDRDVFKGVVRSKGQLWLANANAFPISMHTAGRHLSILPIETPFLAAEDKDDWDEEQQDEHKQLTQTGVCSRVSSSREIYLGT